MLSPLAAGENAGACLKVLLQVVCAAGKAKLAELAAQQPFTQEHVPSLLDARAVP